MTLIAQALARIAEMEAKYCVRGVTCGEVLDLLGKDLPALCALVRALLQDFPVFATEQEAAALKAFVEGK